MANLSTENDLEDMIPEEGIINCELEIIDPLVVFKNKEEALKFIKERNGFVTDIQYEIEPTNWHYANYSQLMAGQKYITIRASFQKMPDPKDVVYIIQDKTNTVTITEQLTDEEIITRYHKIMEKRKKILTDKENEEYSHLEV